MLIIGKRYHSGYKTVGGVVVLFEQFLKDLREYSIAHETIDINKRKKKSYWFSLICALLKICTGVPRHDLIVFHCTDSELSIFGPWVLLLAIVFNKKIVLRKFGGSFDGVLTESGTLKRKFIQLFLRKARIVFLETKHLVTQLKKYNSHTYWFPNYRESREDRKARQFTKRFVFVGQIKSSKGIIEILDVCRKISKDYTLDIYGPIGDFRCPCELKKVFHKHYKGFVEPEQVSSILEGYDVLVLPTYYAGEGYPGVIIEAYSMGIPVISTYWKSIPEIVDNEKTGYLIQPRDSQELMRAIYRISESNYEKLSTNTMTYFEAMFSQKKVIGRIFNILDNEKA